MGYGYRLVEKQKCEEMDSRPHQNLALHTTFSLYSSTIRNVRIPLLEYSPAPASTVRTCARSLSFRIDFGHAKPMQTIESLCSSPPRQNVRDIGLSQYTHRVDLFTRVNAPLSYSLTTSIRLWFKIPPLSFLHDMSFLYLTT
jgi:hypothetical protein